MVQRRQPMRNDHDGDRPFELSQRLLHPRFRHGIERTRRFIEHEQIWATCKRSGNAEPLPLPA